jgi:hypothetical protein
MFPLVLKDKKQANLRGKNLLQLKSRQKFYAKARSAPSASNFASGS